MAEEFTLAELAERVGLQARTIRSYIEQGLLRGPEVGGRGARYSEYHLDRLRAIVTLKEGQGLPLAEVRRRLLTMSAVEMGALARESETARTLRKMPGGSALEYLKSLQRGGAPAPSVSEAPTPMDVLLARLDGAEGARPPRRARGEVWTSIPVTPDVEFRVRGAQTAAELARWERLADHLREILLGGAQEE